MILLQVLSGDMLVVVVDGVLVVVDKVVPWWRVLRFAVIENLSVESVIVGMVYHCL